MNPSPRIPVERERVEGGPRGRGSWERDTERVKTHKSHKGCDSNRSHFKFSSGLVLRRQHWQHEWVLEYLFTGTCGDEGGKKFEEGDKLTSAARTINTQHSYIRRIPPASRPKNAKSRRIALAADSPAATRGPCLQVSPLQALDGEFAQLVRNGPDGHGQSPSRFRPIRSGQADSPKPGQRQSPSILAPSRQSASSAKPPPARPPASAPARKFGQASDKVRRRGAA